MQTAYITLSQAPRFPILGFSAISILRPLASRRKIETRRVRQTNTAAQSTTEERIEAEEAEEVEEEGAVEKRVEAEELRKLTLKKHPIPHRPPLLERMAVNRGNSLRHTPDTMRRYVTLEQATTTHSAPFLERIPARARPHRFCGQRSRQLSTKSLFKRVCFSGSQRAAYCFPRIRSKWLQ